MPKLEGVAASRPEPKTQNQTTLHVDPRSSSSYRPRAVLEAHDPVLVSRTVYDWSLNP